MPERRHVLLLEISYWRKILLESRLDFLKNKYVPLLKNAVDTGVIDLSGWDLTNHDNPETTDQAELFFQAFVRADPDIHKKNVQWMLNIVLSGKSFVEDLDKATQYLEVYEKVKRLLSIEQRDINKYKSFADLYTVIEPLQLEQSKRELDRQVDAEMHGQAEVLYNSATYKILTPLTKAAACYFGTNTQWCTAATRTTNLFDSYNNKSPLYIILDKANNRRWQYHFATGQFTNERDQQIDVSAFIIKYPEAAKALEDMLPKPILDWVEYNANVYRMPNGNIIVIAKLKNVQSILRSGSRILTVQVENNKLVQLVSHNVSFHPKDIAKLLNDQHIEGDRNNQFDLYYQDGRWQTVVEVAKPFLRFKDGWYWGRIKQNDSYRFVLVPSQYWNEAIKNQGYVLDGNLDPNHNHLFRIIQSNTGKETFVKPDRHRHDEVLGQYIVSLLLKIDVNEWEYSSYFSSNRLSEKDAKRLIAKKPYLGDMQTVFKAKGVTPDTRRMALEELEKEGIEHTGKWLGKDRLIVKKWDTIDDCVDDIGTKEGKSFFDYYIKDGGKMDFDYWPEDVSWFKDELLDYVHKEESELFKKMGDYLAKEHPDQLADLFSDEDEEESSYDPSDRHDVEKLLDESDDGDAMQALRSAGEAGSRGGAEGEASKIFQAEVEKNPYLFFTTGEKAFKNKKPRWSKKLQEWDGEVIYAVPLGEVIQAVETDSYNLGHDGWAEALGDGALNPETPYNGMTDFDWEYAKERFVEALQELLD